jgi:hypothetical protein
VAFTELWKSAPQEIQDQRVRQVIGFAGDGSLRDGRDCFQRMPRFSRAGSSPGGVAYSVNLSMMPLLTELGPFSNTNLQRCQLHGLSESASVLDRPPSAAFSIQFTATPCDRSACGSWWPCGR